MRNPVSRNPVPSHLPENHPPRRRLLAFGVLVVFLLTLANPCIHCFTLASTDAEVAVVVAPALADEPADKTPKASEPASDSDHCTDPGNCCQGPGALPPNPQNLDLLQTLAVLAHTGIFIEMPQPALQDPLLIASSERSYRPPAFPLPLRI